MSEVEAVVSLIENEDVFDLPNRGVVQHAGNRPANAKARHSYVAASRSTQKRKIDATAKVYAQAKTEKPASGKTKYRSVCLSKLSVEFLSFYTL